MNNTMNRIAMVLTFISIGSAQLTFEMEASVNYGTYAQNSVVHNDTIWHLGGYFSYSLPFGISSGMYSYAEYFTLEANYWQVDTTKFIYRRYGTAQSDGNHIFIMGGRTYEVLSQVEIFNPQTRTII